jgi:hypothetical protein
MADVADDAVAGFPISLVRNLAWTASNLVRGKPKPAWPTVSDLVKSVVSLLASVKDDEV